MAETTESQLKLSKSMLAQAMRELDFCTMTTMRSTGQLHGRPMSNNREVEWDGDSWFFAAKDSSQVREIQKNRQVSLAYSRPQEMLFITLTGRGEIVEEVAKKQALWQKDLERWFPNGPEDEGVVLIRVIGEYAYYWSKEGDGSLDL